MAPGRAGPRRRARARGRIEELPSGALRVRVYAGIDPVTASGALPARGVPAGPKATAEAEKVARRAAQSGRRAAPPADERDGGPAARPALRAGRRWSAARSATYQGYVDKHIRPLIGARAGRRARRGRLRLLLRRAAALPRPLRPARVRRAPHAAAARVRRPLPAARLPAARCVDDPADPLHPQRCAEAGRPVAVDRHQPEHSGRAAAGAEPNPRPPTAAGGGADPGRGVGRTRTGARWSWLAMVTGLRRGELCGLRWRDVDLDGRRARR